MWPRLAPISTTKAPCNVRQRQPWTSENLRGTPERPDPYTPEDAFRCFMGSEIEVLVAGDCFLRKEQQDPALKLDYRDRFDPD
jgi:carbamoyltransferase